MVGPGRTAQQSAQLMRRGCTIANPPGGTSAKTKVVSFMCKQRLRVLCLIILAVLAGFALIFAIALNLARCSEALHFSQLWLLCFRHMSTFNDWFPVTEDQRSMCLAIVGMQDYVALLLNVTVVALMASVFSRAQATFHFSNQLLYLRRDDQHLLSFRCVHEQGHFTHSISVSLQWVVTVETEQGESYRKKVRLSHNPFGAGGPECGSMPFNITHTMDESSPLFPYRNDLQNAPGNFQVCVTGYDDVSNQFVVGIQWYPVRDAYIGHHFASCHDSPDQKRRWEPTFVPRCCQMGGERLQVDYSKFQLVEQDNDALMSSISGLLAIGRPTDTVKHKTESSVQSCLATSRTLGELAKKSTSELNQAYEALSSLHQMIQNNGEGEPVNNAMLAGTKLLTSDMQLLLKSSLLDVKYLAEKSLVIEEVLLRGLHTPMKSCSAQGVSSGVSRADPGFARAMSNATRSSCTQSSGLLTAETQPNSAVLVDDETWIRHLNDFIAAGFEAD